MLDQLRKPILLLLVFLSFTLQSITGFGGALLAMPFASFLIGLDNARVVLNAVSWITGLAVAVKNRRSINWRVLAEILLFMFVGILIGLWLDKCVEPSLLFTGYALTIVGIACGNLFVKKQYRLSRCVLWAVLLAAGIMHGLFVSGGAFLMIYAMQTLENKNAFRATSCAVWAVLNLYMMFKQWRGGLFTPENLALAALCLAASALAVYVAEKLQSRLDQKRFMTIINILLLLTGMVMLLT